VPVLTRRHGVADAALRLEYFLAGGGIAGEGGGGGPASSRPVITVRRHIPRTTTTMIFCASSIFIMTVELLIEDSQAAFGNKPCRSSTNLAAMPLSNSA
jgi:hypothetical protein